MPTFNQACRFCWRLLDAVFLFGLGNTYIQRFKGYRDIEEEEKRFEWRHRQQREWDRLSTALALLATMMAAILALTPEPPGLAAALWLSGSAVAVSGLFVTIYLSVKAFDIKDAEMPQLVMEKRYSHAHLVPIAITCPPVAACWASLLFTVGLFDYTIKYPFAARAHLGIALVPMTCSVATVCAIIFVGENLTGDIKRNRRNAQSQSTPTSPIAANSTATSPKTSPGAGLPSHQ